MLSSSNLVDEISAFQAQLSKGVCQLKALPMLESKGFTPFDVVYQVDKVRLLHYQGIVKPTQATPLLIVYALVNRPYMTDLQENRSMIQGLLAAGLDVYLVDWGYPDATDCYVNLDDYLNGYLHQCVMWLTHEYRVPQINLLGICQGGVFSLCYSAMHPDQVKNLITMVTPVDFHTPDNVLSHAVQQINIDQLVDALGNVPGQWLNETFLNLKPYSLRLQKYLTLVDLFDKPTVLLENFLRMELWILDSPDQAGETIRQFIKDFFQGNKLVRGSLQIGRFTVSLASLRLPILNIYATEDHLVPPSASLALRHLVSSSDYQELSFSGGHIGIYVSRQAQREIPPQIGTWLVERS